MVNNCQNEDGWVYTNPNGPYDSIELCGAACDAVKIVGEALTAEIVMEIRADKSKMSYSMLSAKYGIAIGHLHRIVTRKAWK
jgi:hypothetical protein